MYEFELSTMQSCDFTAKCFGRNKGVDLQRVVQTTLVSDEDRCAIVQIIMCVITCSGRNAGVELLVFSGRMLVGLLDVGSS